MSYKFTTKTFNTNSVLLSRMAEAHATSGTPLRDDLKQTLDQVRSDYTTRLNRYLGLRGQEKELRQVAADRQAEAVQLLLKTRHALQSQMPKSQADGVLEVYRLNRERPKSRMAVLGSLRMVVEAIAQQSEATRKPPQPLVTALQQAYTDLNAKIEATNGLRADLETARRELRDSLLAIGELRERVYSFLVAALPESNRDPRLIDYGLRQKFGTRGRSVTVVEVEQTPEPVVDPEPQPQPNPAP